MSVSSTPATISFFGQLSGQLSRSLGNPGRNAAIVLGILAAFSVAMPSLIVATAVGKRSAASVIAAKRPIVPPQEMPPVDPVNLVDLAPDDARSINAAVPFSVAPNPAARPFVLPDAGVASARALDCLATAVLYEAGDDTTGQRAVAQVIINRVRHPAFPKTICGVVFQGAERRTGCQFTFTCDGALYRHRWSDAAWARARTVAGLALRGQVFAKVGHATHYHTDWVVPYWSASLDKVSAVGTHLFFRWTGWWGTPAAFNRRVSGLEPNVAQLAAYSPVHGSGPGYMRLNADDDPLPSLGVPRAMPGDPNAFLVTVDWRADPDSFRALAETACGNRRYCKFMAWTERFETPGELPLEHYQVATMGFSYLRDRARGFEKALWSCAQFPRADRSQCMKAQTFVPGVPGPAAVANQGTEPDDDNAGRPAITKAASDEDPLPPPFLLTPRATKSRLRGSGTAKASPPGSTTADPATSSVGTAAKSPAP